MQKRFIMCLALVLGQVVGFVAHANDNTGNYSQSAGNWTSGAHRGDLWAGDWTLESSAEFWAAAGQFIGSSTFGAGNIDSDGKSFGMFANPSGDPQPFAAAVKRFGKPAWTTGDEISFQVSLNWRNGNKGFNLRDVNGNNRWLFSVRNDAYYINDDNTSISGYHANTVFTFTFIQRERSIDWTVERSGGISTTVSGSDPIRSGSIADVRFFIVGTEAGDVNNLYFNNFTFTPGARGDAPLSVGERRFPGHAPSYILRFTDPDAHSVTFRSSNDGWTTSYPLTKIDDVWQFDIRDANLSPGWYSWKFRVNNDYEPGSNRHLYIDANGMIAKPPAVYLTWQHDPTTTMTAHWHTYHPTNTGFRYRELGAGPWTSGVADETRVFPYTERLIQIAEMTGLSPNSDYELEVDGYDETFSFRTMPATLDQPLRGMFTGDILYGSATIAMAQQMGALDPAFLMIGGDLAYSDGREDLLWIEYRYFENMFTHFRAPDGRLIPWVLGIGNHEVKKGYITGYVFHEDTDAWRAREAPYFFAPYAWPGQPGYGALDFGNYMSLIVLDTEHANPIIGAQTDWLSARLDERREVPHLFPVYHVPAYPSHREPASRNQRIRDNWLPLLEGAGVHLVFEHHDHAYKRTTPLLNDEIHGDGIVFLGDGAWGVDLRSVHNPTALHDFQITQSRRHAFLVTMTETGRLVQAVDVDGVLFDQLYQEADGIPSAPTGLTIERVTSGSVDFSWSRAPRAQSYRVERNGVEIGATEALYFIDDNRTPDSAASYQVFAVNRSGESTGSAPLEIQTTAIPPVPATPFAPDGEALGPTSIRIEWLPVPHAYSYVIRRDGDVIAEDIQVPWYHDVGLAAETAYAYSIQAANVSGSSAQSDSTLLQTSPAIIPYALDGLPDHAGYLLDSPGMTLYAALRGTELYVATWTPAGGVSDHFIFLSDDLLPTASQRAPWQKKGFTAHPEGAPYLAAESTSDFIAWHNAPGSVENYRSSTGGEKIEGVIDVVQAFGAMPDMIYLAAAYGTADLGVLNAQAPQGNGDENIQPDEFLALPVEAIRDSLGVGVYDRLDPLRGLEVSEGQIGTQQGFLIRWRSVPGRQYHVWRSDELAGGQWTRLTDTPLTAPWGADEMTYEDIDSADLPFACYSVEAL